MILTVQCAIGPIGAKPVTQLKYANAGNFAAGLINTGTHQYGMNEGGVWQLNHPSESTISPTDDGLEIEYDLKLNKTDFGLPGNLKKIRFLQATISGTPYKIQFYTDQARVKDSNFSRRNDGARAVVDSRKQHTYWDIGIKSNDPFILLDMTATIITRPLGTSNR
jgi:hypothetical protein